MTVPRSFDLELFARGLEELDAGRERHVRHHRIIDSTSSELFRELSGGVGPGAVVIASRQTGGRGRQGRQWHSPEAGNLYISLAVSFTGEPSKILPLIPLAAGVSAVDAIGGSGGSRPRLKWPNDLLVNGRKLAGILCEVKDLAGRPLVAVVGLGLNLGPVAFPPDIAAIAVDLASIDGGFAPAEEMAAAWVAGLESWVVRLGRGEVSALVSAWRDRAEPFGRRVRAGALEGVTVDLDHSGRLLLRLDNGATEILPGGIVENIDD